MEGIVFDIILCIHANFGARLSSSECSEDEGRGG